MRERRFPIWQVDLSGQYFAELDLDPSRYVKSQKRLLQDATATTLNIESNFKKLGVKSAAEFDLLRARAVNAFERIKNSNQVTANDIVRAEKAKNEQLKRLNEQQFGSQTSLLTKFKNNWLAATSVIVASIYTIRKAWDIINLSAQFDQAMASFKNLTDSYGVNANRIIEDLRRASAGTIATIDLVQKAGTAMLFGIDPTKISKLMEIARATSRITGQTVSKAFEDIALAVGRQSKKILDNLGILVSVESANEAYAKSLGKTSKELTDVERRQAFLNATLVEGEKMMARLGTSTKTTAEVFQSFSAFVENSKTVLGSVLIEAIKKVTVGFTWMGIAFNTIMADMASFFSKDLESHFRGAVEKAEKFIAEINQLKESSSAAIPRAISIESEQSAIGADMTAADQRRVSGLQEALEAMQIAETSYREWEMAEIQKTQEFKDAYYQLDHDNALRWARARTEGEVALELRRLAVQKQARKDAIENSAFFFQQMGQQSRAAFEIYKGIEIAQTIVSTIGAAQKAYEAGMSVGGPYAPYIAAAYAAAALAAGYAKVSAISSLTPDGGGGAVSAGGTVGTYPVEPLTSLPSQTKTEEPRGTVNIYIEGDILGDKASMEYLAESLSEYVEKYDVRLVASHAKIAERTA